MTRGLRVRAFVVTASTAALVAFSAGAPAIASAAVSVNLDQWASSDKAWQNGNLNGNNSRYPEGGVVPFRLAIEGLKPGTHTIHINYDFTAGGHKAYDFLATWDITNAKGKVCIPSGGAISSMCPNLPTPTSRAFPSDDFKANGLSVRGAEAYSGASRRLTIWGGTITSIAGPTHAGSVNGNSTADFLVTFRALGPAVLMAWGGHLAQSSYWDTASGGARDGASLVSGAPWHVRTLKLDGAGNKNQDRSIQPSAIVGEVPPQGLAPTPPPAQGGTPPQPGGGNPPQPGGGNPAVPGRTHFPFTAPPTTTIEPAGTGEASIIPILLVVVFALAALLEIAGRRPRRSNLRGD
jgi:hypothetical protein